MAFEDFRRNVLGAAPVIMGYITPPDVSPINRETIGAALERSTNWLNPQFVYGFNSSDLSFLPPHERLRIADWVNDFRGIATLAQDGRAWTRELLDIASDHRRLLDYARKWEPVDRNSMPDHNLNDTEKDLILGELVKLATPILEEIILFLEADHFLTADAFRAGKQIEARLRMKGWPDELSELKFHSGMDHSGDPGLWIWVFLKDTVLSSDEAFKTSTRRIRTLLREIAKDVTSERFPYISFRTVSERVPALEEA